MNKLTWREALEKSDTMIATREVSGYKFKIICDFYAYGEHFVARVGFVDWQHCKPDFEEFASVLKGWTSISDPISPNQITYIKPDAEWNQ